MARRTSFPNNMWRYFLRFVALSRLFFHNRVLVPTTFFPSRDGKMVCLWSEPYLRSQETRVCSPRWELLSGLSGRDAEKWLRNVAKPGKKKSRLIRDFLQGEGWARDSWLLRSRWSSDDFMLHSIKEQVRFPFRIARLLIPRGLSPLWVVSERANCGTTFVVACKPNCTESEPAEPC